MYFKKIVFVPSTLVIFLTILVSQPLLAKENGSSSDNVLVKDGNIEVTTKDAELMLEDMNDIQRQRLLNDRNKLEQLILNLVIHKKKALEAIKLGLDKSEFAKWKTDIAKSNVLVAELTKYANKNVKFPKSLEANAKQYYQTHPEEFKVASKAIHAAHILFAVDVGNEEKKLKQFTLAKKVHAKLKMGYNFNLLAEKYSSDKASAAKGGDLGKFTRGKMVPAFEEAAFALKEKDDLSGIVETQFGYHIIKLLEPNNSEDQIKSYEQVKKELIQIEKDKFVAYEVNKYLNAFNTNKDSTIFVPAMDALYDTLKNKVETDLNSTQK